MSSRAPSSARTGTLLATASDDKTARIWNVATAKPPHPRGHSGPVEAAAFSPDGKLVVTSSDDKTARIWNVTNGKRLHTLSGNQSGVLAAAFSPDSSLVVTGGGDGTVQSLARGER